MIEIQELEGRREQILTEIRNIGAMRKGSVTEQFLKTKRKGSEELVVNGPYYLYTRKEKGKSVGRRLSEEQADRYRVEVEAFHRFQALCNEYAETTERLADLKHGCEDGRQEKKQRRRPSRRTKK
jgi:hypothetical protein